MAISYAGKSGANFTVDSGGQPPSLSLPEGLLVGDLMVALYYSDGVADEAVDIAALGWTAIANQRSSGGLIALWWKLYQIGDAPPDFIISGADADSSYRSAQLAAWRGVRRTSPIQGVGAIGTFAPAAATIGPIGGLSAAADSLVVCAGGKLRASWGRVDTLDVSLDWHEIDEPRASSSPGFVWDYGVVGGSPVTVGSQTFVLDDTLVKASKGVMFSVFPGTGIGPQAAMHRRREA